MHLLITSMLRALRSLLTPGMVWIALMSMLLTLVALGLFIFIGSTTFSWLGEHSDNPLLAYILPWAGSVGSFLIAWFLFPGIMPVIVNFFDSQIAGMIEKRDYPNIISGHTPAFWPELWHDVRFSLMAVGLNILVLPLYIIFPVLNLFLFYWLNGTLLGREFFVMAARRHMPIAQATELRKRHNTVITIAGACLTVLATLPVTNLFAPFWGIALMIHLFHGIQRTPPSELIPPRISVH